MPSFADRARKIPGVAKVEGAVAGATATQDDLPIADYDAQSAADIASKLKGFSQRELRTIAAYERKRENRATIIDRIAQLSGDEPWSGFDELGVDAVAKAVREGTVETARTVRTYEREHKDRAGVIEAADRRIDAN